MRVLGLHNIAITSLVLPGDFRKRMERDHVKELATSIKGTGQINPVTVRKDGMRLITGGDRVAAHLILGDEKVLAMFIDCTDLEADNIRDEENVRRRYDATERLATLARLIQRRQTMVADDFEKPMVANPRKPPGRPANIASLARAQVAKELGMSVEAVRYQEKKLVRLARQEKTAEIDEAIGASRVDADTVVGDNIQAVIAESGSMLQGVLDALPAKFPATIKTMGVELGQEWLIQVATVQRQFEQAAGHLRAAQVNLTAVQNMGPEAYPAARLSRLYEHVHEAAFEVRGARPESLCPFCKGQPGIQEQCAACVTLGFLTASQIAAVPAELWLEGDQAKVVIQGQMVLISKLEPEDAPQLFSTEPGEFPPGTFSNIIERKPPTPDALIAARDSLPKPGNPVYPEPDDLSPWGES